MAIQWEHEDLHLVVFRVSAKLGKAELDMAQREAEAIIQKGGAKLLVIAEGFTGWDKQGDWGDLSFSERNDQHIEKMAIVADEKWRDLADTFTLKGLRGFPIEFFDENQESTARQWLAE